MNKNLLFQEYHTDSEKNENSDHALNERQARTSHEHPSNADFLQYDADDEQNVKESAANDLETETPDEFVNVRTSPTTTRSKIDVNIELDTISDHSKVSLFSQIDELNLFNCTSSDRLASN